MIFLNPAGIFIGSSTIVSSFLNNLFFLGIKMVIEKIKIKNTNLIEKLFIKSEIKPHIIAGIVYNKGLISVIFSLRFAITKRNMELMKKAKVVDIAAPIMP